MTPSHELLLNGRQLSNNVASVDQVGKKLSDAASALTETEESELKTWRVLIIVFTVITGLFFYIPFCRCCQKFEGQVMRYPETVSTYYFKNRCIQFMNCFAGGALFSLALCHILPETQKEYAMYLKQNNKKYLFFEKFPFVYFLIIAGFILTLCLDQVLFKPTLRTVEYITRAQDYVVDEVPSLENRERSGDNESIGSNAANPVKSPSKQQILTPSQVNNQQQTPGTPGSAKNSNKNDINEGGQLELFVVHRGAMADEQTVVLDKTMNFQQFEGGDEGDGDRDGQVVLQTEEAQIDTERQLAGDEEGEGQGQEGANDILKPPKPPVLPAPEIIAPQSLFIVAMIFILHSFIMGLTIGAFKEVKEIGLIAVIVILQKIPIALSFGVLFLSAGRMCCSGFTIIFGVIFTAATPIGVGLMWANLDEHIRKSDPAILCIQGGVCGALIYIACSDLIAREFQASEDINPNDQREEHEKKWQQRLISVLKWFFVVLGCAFVLSIFTVGGQDLTDPDSRLQQKVEISLPNINKINGGGD